VGGHAVVVRFDDKELTMPRENRDQPFVIRLTVSEKKRIDQAAWEAHLDMSTWARNLLLKEIDRLLSRKRDR